MIYEEVKDFYRNYKDRKLVIGKSWEGRDIFAFHVGDEENKQFVSAYAFHGREWITARLALKHLELKYKTGGWVIPLVNPDGAIISQTLDKMWKANGRGVDINCNFPADWGTGKLNVRKKGSENCIGEYPFSETESYAVAKFTKQVCPFVTFAFHTKGGEIYWEYGGRGDERGAKLLSLATGYPFKKITGSAGGYKDWCLQSLNIPSYTIECGRDSLSHPIDDVEDIKECFNAIKFFTDNYEK